MEPQWVETEEDLRNMKNDLSGWYILKNDIALTDEWMPVGTYYASYEYLSASWWKYAFSGALDGNGYSIKGLQIKTLEPYGDTVHPIEGSGNGTTALFGSICDAEISDLVIESPQAETDRQLVIFGDSFASSLAPLLCESYSRITIFDLRFIHSSLVEDYIEFSDQDVLFLYSDWIASNSALLR